MLSVYSLYFFVLVSLLIESLTSLLLKADILNRPRNFLIERSSFLQELLSCGYCFSFWISLFLLSLVYLSRQEIPLAITFIPFIDFFLNVIIFHRLSNIWHGMIDKYFDKYYDKRYRSSAPED